MADSAFNFGPLTNPSVKLVSSNTTLTINDYDIWVNTSGGPVTITYPQIDGKQWDIKKTTADANMLKIIGVSGNTNGQAFYSTNSTTLPSFTLKSNGSEGQFK